MLIMYYYSYDSMLLVILLYISFLDVHVCICLYVRRTPWQISPTYGLKGLPVEK